MAIQVLSGATNTIWTIDTTSNAGRITLYDQYGTAMSDISSLSNILNALNSNVTIVLGGQATLGINIGGTTGSLTASFEATIDNSTWFALSSTPVNGGNPVTSTAANGQWVASTSGFYAIRVRISAFTSGSMTVSVVVTPEMSKIVAQAITTAGALSVEITDGSADGPAAVKPASTAAIATDPALVVAISPNNSVAVTTASLPLPAGAATSANQTNGTQETQIVQGGNTVTVTASSALKVDASAVTQPVSGTVTANAGTGTFTVSGTVAATQSGTWTVQPGNTPNTTPWLSTISQGGNSATVTASNALKVDGSAVTQPISAASLPLPTGAATSANLTTLGTQTTELNDGTRTATIKAASTAAVATDTALVVAVSPNNTIPISAASLPLPTGAATSANQTNGNQETQIVQGGNTATVTASSALKVDGSAVTQPVSGTVTANAGTGNFTVVQGTAANLNATVTGTVAATQSGTWTVQPGNTANTTPWLATINQGGNSATVTASNALKVDGSAVTQPISAASLPLPTGAATATNQTTLGTQTTELNDGTHTATIKAASTQSLATDTALVVALAPGSAQTRSSTTTVVGVASSASSVTILAANSARLGAIITNNSTAILYLKYAATAASIASGGYTVTVAISNGTHEVYAGYTGQITGIWASANGYCQVCELSP